MKTLNKKNSELFYDKFGRKQDNQAYYEDLAINDQLENSELSTAKNVFEFGCGTGRLAEKILRSYLPEDSSYNGLDISSTMIELSTKRLALYKERIHLIKSTGAINVQLPDESIDRFISNYVLDLLSYDDIDDILNEAYRLLEFNGIISLISITNGKTIISKIVMNTWNFLFKINPKIVGGCRPIKIKNIINKDTRWEIVYENVKIAYGIASEIIIARKK